MVFQIFRTVTVKVLKPTVKPIDRHNARSNSLPRVDTGPNLSLTFGKLTGSPFLPERQALSEIRHGSPQFYKTDFLSISASFLGIRKSHMFANQGVRLVGDGR